MIGARVDASLGFGPAFGRFVRTTGAAFVLALCIGVPGGPAAAQSDRAQVSVAAVPGAEELAVATRVLPPFVMGETAGDLTGFSVELWRAIAVEAGLKSRFQVYDTLPDLLDAVQSGKNPVGIAAISITADREQRMEFSQPMYRSGLQIMARAGDGNALGLLGSLLSLPVLEAIGLFFLALLVPAHVAWAIHRFDPTSSWNIPRSYWPGILDAFYWSVEKMASTASGAPGGHAGRVFNILWSFLCVIVLASLTALIASALTVSSLRREINGPNDLVGKRVATVAGSTSAAYLRKIGAIVDEFPDFDGATRALGQAGRKGPVALVYDAPIILYFVNKDADHRFAAIGAPFREENYGIAYPLNTTIRHAVDAALVRLVENGTYDQIRDKWFAKPATQN